MSRKTIGPRNKVKGDSGIRNTACYACGIALSKNNRSSEHIIPNSLGGKLKSRNLMCVECNSNFGKTIDNYLAEDFMFFSNAFNVKRQRGTPQPIPMKRDKTGEQLLRFPDGTLRRSKPTYSITKEADGDKLNVEARNKSELKSILKGLQKRKKLPSFDIDKAMEQSKDVWIDFEVGHISFAIGSEETFRAISKIALNYFFLKGGKREDALDCIAYLKGRSDSERVWYFYPDNDIIKDRRDDEILHSIGITGNPKTRLLLAHVELFSACRFIVLINDNYTGNKIDFNYHYDVVNQTVITKIFSPAIERDEILQIFNNSELPLESFQNAMENVNKVIWKFSNEQGLNRIVDRALKRFQKEHDFSSLDEMTAAKLIAAYATEEAEPLIRRSAEIKHAAAARTFLNQTKVNDSD